MEMMKNIRVLELASVLAGPAVGQFFAELGATVIKVENKRSGGDVTRHWKVKGEDQSKADSAYFNAVNFNKEHLFLDLKDQTDQQKINDLIINSNIVIVNFKAGDAEKLKLDFESVKRLNPSIIYGEIIGFRDSKRLAYDMVLQAESGWLSMNGTSEGQLCKIPVAVIDLFAAHQLKEGILLALLNKNQKAQKVSVSLYDAAVSALANQATNWLVAQHEAKPMGMLHPNIAPYGELFKAKDEKLFVLAIGSDSQFEALCRLINLADLINDDRFKNNSKRVFNRKTLAETLKNAFVQYNRTHWMKSFEENNIPAGGVKSISEVFENSAAQELVLSKEGTVGLSQIAFKIEE